MRSLPLAFPGLAVGLLGGSFDPAHEGHVHVAEVARKRLGLMKVWWLASPQNPLKARSSPLDARLASARALARGPAMVVSDLETRLRLRFTRDTLRALRRLYPGVRFVWLMGGDNLPTFHHWRAWREIAALAPICVVSRPGTGARALLSRFAQSYCPERLAPARSGLLANRRPPAWTYLCARHVAASSTALRATGRGLNQTETFSA